MFQLPRKYYCFDNQVDPTSTLSSSESSIFTGCFMDIPTPKSGTRDASAERIAKSKMKKTAILLGLGRREDHGEGVEHRHAVRLSAPKPTRRRHVLTQFRQALRNRVCDLDLCRSAPLAEVFEHCQSADRPDRDPTPLGSLGESADEVAGTSAPTAPGRFDVL